ncbi:hypothetical protein HTVC023P_gp23 [Pelagibacter phage HTVC023P]|nr:hypothetical protein HTVC023P_gp23 [Pelagibacter phage HTVC023P]
MGFDLTGVNPQITIKEPKRPDNLFDESITKEEQDKYFEEREQYQNQKGTYFRNNVWWWRPLAEYVIRFTKVVSDKDAKMWHYNDQHLVNDKDAKMIAQQLDHLISSGHTKKYADDFEKIRAEIEKKNEEVEKELQEFSESVRKKLNDKNLAPKDFPKKDKQLWDRIFDKRDNRGSYPFSLENVKEFAEFCRYSGGFTIG